MHLNSLFLVVLLTKVNFATTEVVTVTAPIITPRPTGKFSSPLPPCVLGCLQKAVQSSGCKTNDDKCACANPVYQSTSRACITATCSPKEQELASHLQQKCGESSRVLPTMHSTTTPQAAMPTTNVMAVMTAKPTQNAAACLRFDYEKIGICAFVTGFLGLGLAL